MAPALSAEELAELNQRRNSKRLLDEASPAILAERQFSRALRGVPPAPRVESGTNCTSTDLAEWHRERFVPQNAIVGISGNIHAAKAIAVVRRTLGHWRRTDFTPGHDGGSRMLSMPSAHLLIRPNSVQTTIWIGGLAADRQSDDYFPMVVLNRLLGEGPSSRLHRSLRESRGLAYAVESALSVHVHPPNWRAVADVRSEASSEALALMLAEIERLRSGDVSDQEVEKCKHSILAAFAFSLERSAASLTLALENRRLGLGVNTMNTFIRGISSVTPGAVRSAARKYLDSAALHIIVVGDVQALRSAIEKLMPATQVLLTNLPDTTGQQTAR